MAFLDETPIVRERTYYQWGWTAWVQRARKSISEIVVKYRIDDEGGESVPVSRAHSVTGATCLLQSRDPQIADDSRFGMLVCTYRHESDWIPYP